MRTIYLTREKRKKCPECGILPTKIGCMMTTNKHGNRKLSGGRICNNCGKPVENLPLPIGA